MTIVLKRNEGFAWFKRGGIQAKGYLFDRREKFRDKESLLDYFETVRNLQEFKQKVLEANGFFAVVVKTDKHVFAAVDRLRSIPLFYARSGRDMIIADEARSVREALGDDDAIDEIAKEAFLRAGYTLNDDTLYCQVKQIQAGEFLSYNKTTGQVATECYFRHAHGNYVDKPLDVLVQELDDVTSQFTNRLIESCQDKAIVAPLSGGYDSRHIVCALKRAGFENVICYTYGLRDSFEVRFARQVAAVLEYPIHVIEYSRAKWKAALNSPEFVDYCRYVSNDCAVPHFQEFPALKELRDRRALPKESVIVPGFCGDLLGGSYVPIEVATGQAERLLEEGIANYVFRQTFHLLKDRVSRRIRSEIIESVSSYTSTFDARDLERFCSVREDWFTRHKVAKYVVNSLRIYEWFGYQWRMPLWDNDLIEWWYRIPLPMRTDSTLLHQYLFERLFNLLGVGFARRINKRRVEVPLRKVLPRKVVDVLLDTYLTIRPRSGTKNINAFDDLRVLLRERMPKEMKHGNIKHVVGLTGVWWLSHAR